MANFASITQPCGLQTAQTFGWAKINLTPSELWIYLLRNTNLLFLLQIILKLVGIIQDLTPCPFKSTKNRYLIGTL